MYPEFIETPVFMRLADRLLSIEGRELATDLLVGAPESGRVIPDSGGLRKIRLRRPGRGKRGGPRLIYALPHGGTRIYLVFLYAKSEKTELSRAQVRALGRTVDELNQEFRRPRSGDKQGDS